MTFLAGYLFGVATGLLLAAFLVVRDRRRQRQASNPTPLVTRPHDWPHDQ
jgi:hypothetical protein